MNTEVLLDKILVLLDNIYKSFSLLKIKLNKKYNPKNIMVEILST